MALQPPCRSLIRARQLLRCRMLISARSYATTETATTTTTITTGESSTEFPARQRDTSSVPRWSQTPAGMKAPIQLDHAKKFENKIWTVNSDPARLDDMYNRLLGPGGSKMLPAELKWLAVTHKSFDQGRRGFNDKLALMGMYLLDEKKKEEGGKQCYVGRLASGV